MPKSIPWYDQYDEIRAQVSSQRTDYEDRCEALGASRSAVLQNIWSELIARAVVESNWQEGLELDEPRTFELAIEALEDLGGVLGPHVDMEGVLRSHYRAITRIMRRGATKEEIGAYNLATAHHVIPYISLELRLRQTASLAYALKGLEPHWPRLQRRKGMTDETRHSVELGFQTIKSLVDNCAPMPFPTTDPSLTQGEYLKHLLAGDFSSLVNPMRPAYLHFFHKITLTGLYPSAKRGRLRTIPVSVGRSDVQFPPAAAVPGLVEEYCKSFPSLIRDVSKYDPIMTAAEESYKFVSIHPYCDGNGRVSRLLMNLVLWAHGYPPVYLKADKKGRHRYAQALQRANKTGTIRPLATLIAKSLSEIYEKLYKAVRKPDN